MDGGHITFLPFLPNGGTSQRESPSRLSTSQIPTSHESTSPTPQPSITTVVSITSPSEPSANAPSESAGSPLRVPSLPSGNQLGANESTLTTEVPSTSLTLIEPNGSPSSMSSGFSTSPEGAPVLPMLSTPSSTTQTNSSSFGGSTVSASASTSGSTGSSTPVAAPTRSNVNISGLIIAVIVISILVLLASLALGVRYFIRRHRQREIALLNRVESVDPISATMNQIRSSSRSTVSSMMTNGNVTSTDAPTIVGRLPEPNRFASPPSSPVRVKLVAHDVPDVYASSQTTPDLKYPDAVTRTAAVTSPAPSSHDSLSFKVPFFYHLRAMRRRGELCKAPAIEPPRMEPAIQPLRMEYTDSDSDSIYSTGGK